MRVWQAVFISSLVSATVAHAETFAVQIQGIEPKTAAKVMTCTQNNKLCFLSLPLRGGAGPADYIDIAVKMAGQDIQMEFMRDRTILPIANDGRTVLTVPLETSQTVFLLDPETLEKPSLIQKPVLRQGRVVARIKVRAFKGGD